MKEQDHLFENFKENAEKLSVPPSNLAWEKLEAKLDAQETNKKEAKTISMVRVLAIAASLTLILGTVFTLNNRTNDATSIATNTSMSLEDLESVDNTNSSPQLIAYRKKINAQPEGIIQEGSYYKRLVSPKSTGKRNLFPVRKRS